MDPRSQEMRPQGFRFQETEEEILELSTVLIPWAGDAATTTTATLEPTHRGTKLDSHDFSSMSDAGQHVNSRSRKNLGLTRHEYRVRV